MDEEYVKYEFDLITLDNKTVLEEFKTEEQAIKCAKNIKDFIKNKHKKMEE